MNRSTAAPFVYDDNPGIVTEVVCVAIAGAAVVAAFRYAHKAVRVLARKI
jgi:hypothetical protein